MTGATRLICLLLAASCLCQALGRQVVLGPDNLLPSLNDSTVTDIILSEDYDLQPTELGQLEDAPLRLTRNVTLSGPAGGPAPVLDLHFAHAVLQLCASCMFTFADMAVANERRGTGPTYDVFTGEAGSVVRAVNVTRVRLACTPAADSTAIIQHTPRSTQLHGSQQQQAFTFVDVTFKGSRYPQSLRNEDVTRDVPLVYEEGRGRSGGYALADIRTTRICLHTVEHSCLQRKGPDACVNRMIDEVLGDTPPLSAAAQKGPGRVGLPPATLAAAIAVPLGAAGMLLLAGVALWQRRRRRVQADASLVAKAAECGGGNGGVRRGYSRNSQERPSSSSSRPEEGGCATDRKLPRQPLGEGPGWSLTNSLTSPCIAAGSDTRVVFGDLIGSGSFGRVFRARWAGMAVAIKVIEHSSETSEAVQQEATLMLALNHPNIIRAFHCVTFSSSNPEVIVTRAPQGSSSTSGSLLSCTSPSTATPSSLSACNQPAIEALPAVAPAPATDAAAGPVSPVSGAGLSAADWGSSPGCVDGFMGTSDSIRQSGTDEGPAHCETWLIQEYADVGTLQAVSSKWPPGALGGEAELFRLMLLRDAAAGLCELHRMGIVHGDLNTRNVLVSSSAMSRCGLVAKLADLGLSRILHGHKTHRTTNLCGTMSCMPPELLASGRLSPAADVYALAITMWEMASGCQAFRKLAYGQFFATIVLRDQRPPLLPGLASDYQTLMQHCWATNPADRPTSPQVLACLDWMIGQRLRVLAGGAAAAAPGEAAGPPALLLKPPPPRLQMPQPPQPGSPSSCMPTAALAPGVNSSSASSASEGDDGAAACSYLATAASPPAAAPAAAGGVAGGPQAVGCTAGLKPPSAPSSSDAEDGDLPRDTAEWPTSCEFQV